MDEEPRLIYCSDLWCDMRDKERTVLWMEIFEIDRPNERLAKNQKKYFIKINKRRHKVLPEKEGYYHSQNIPPETELNVHDPHYWIGYLDKNNLIEIELRDRYPDYQETLRILKSQLKSWTQSKKRTVIKLVKRDQFYNHINGLVDFLNKYSE